MRTFARGRPLRWGWCVLLLVLANLGMAQAKFVINGRLKVDGGGLDGCRMVVYKDGAKHRTISADLNRFSLDLELGANYVLSFEKAGFVTKKLQFNTRLPAGVVRENLAPFQFVVSLFKQYEGLNTVVFNQPVGMIRYDPMLGDFDYDTDYTKSIQSALEAAQLEVERKQKEAVRAEAEEAQRKQQEAKDQAKQKAAQAKIKAEQDKAAQQLAQAMPVAAMAPVPASKPEPKVERAPVLPAAKQRRAASTPKAMETEESRRALEPRVLEEPRRVQPAVAHSLQEPRPKFEPTAVLVVRHQDVIVQPNEVITVIKLGVGEEVTEYRRVARKYSGVFYFKNGRSCSKQIYESEALAEN